MPARDGIAKGGPGEFEKSCSLSTQVIFQGGDILYQHQENPIVISPHTLEIGTSKLGTG